MMKLPTYTLMFVVGTYQNGVGALANNEPHHYMFAPLVEGLLTKKYDNEAGFNPVGIHEFKWELALTRIK